MEQDSDSLRPTYQLTKIGMILSGLSLILFALDSATQGIYLGTILCTLRLPPRGMVIFEAIWWDLLLKLPMNVFALFGAYMLWGRWQQSSWQARTGLLVVMNLIDMVLWTTRHAEYLNLGPEYLGHEWFIRNFTRALEWAELALLTSLAADVWTHLGSPRAAEASLATRKMIASGALFWMMTFCHRTAWNRGWPLVQWGGMDAPTILFMTGVSLLRTIVIFQAISLTFGAAKACKEVVAEIDSQERPEDLLISRSEVYAGKV